MATTRTWIGGARTQHMVQTITVGSNTDTHTFLVHIGHPSGVGLEAITIASDTASSDTTATIAAELYAQLSASTHEFSRRVSWSYPGSGAVITATAVYAGEPFVLTETGTGTLTVATTTANAGPNDWGTPGNWAEGAVPIANDDVTIQGNVEILWGLNQSAVALDTMNVVNYSGKIGSRGLPLTIDCEEELQFDFGGQASIRFATVSVASIIVHRTGGGDYGLAISALTGVVPTLTAVTVISGSVLFGLTRLEKVDITTLTNVTGEITVFDGTTVTTAINSGIGTMDLLNDGDTITLVRVDGGLVTSYTPITTMTQNGGQVDYMQNNIGTYNLNNGLLETRKSRLARTISTLNHAQAGTINRDTAAVTITAHNEEGPMQIRGIGDSGL